MEEKSTLSTTFIGSLFLSRLTFWALLLVVALPGLAQPANSCAPTFLNNQQIILDASCNKNDGQISIIPQSGVPPFLYSIDSGTTYTPGPNGGYTFFNLGAGTYYLRLKDSNGCTSPAIPRQVTAKYGGPTFSNEPSLTKNPSCLQNDGSITIIPTNPDATYQYSIDGGTTYVDGPSTGYTFTNLKAGLYYARLKVSDGCESTLEERLLNDAPSPYVVANLSEEFCGKKNGAITLHPSHGTPPYLFSIDDGATYRQGPEAGYTFRELAAGNYHPVVKDSVGCISPSYVATLTNNNNCPVVTLPDFPQITGILPMQALTTEEALLTYPNPGTGKFKLKFQQFISPKVEVSIYNMKGVLVDNRWINPIRFKTSLFDLTAHPAGVYYLKVVSPKGITSTKIVIQ